jgi:hypothetical protein
MKEGRDESRQRTLVLLTVALQLLALFACRVAPEDLGQVSTVAQRVRGVSLQTS